MLNNVIHLRDYVERLKERGDSLRAFHAQQVLSFQRQQLRIRDHHVEKGVCQTCGRDYIYEEI